MNEQQLAHYRTRLNTLRTELEEALSADSEETSPVAPDRAIGRLTRQDAIQSQQMALEIRRRNQGRLRQVEQALKRIDDGTYGECLRCEEEISDARLKVRPETPICIDCAEGRAT